MIEIIMLGLVICIIVLLLKDGRSRSRGYRKTLTDLYVAAKIRKLSKEDGLDLVEEYEAFKAWIKKERIETHSLDETIEEDLQNKVNKTKKTEEKKKE